MSQSNSPLLHLPRELRDKIYHYAIFEPAGYRYDLKSGRLRTSHDAPINLSLSYTCRQIYSETNNLGLSTNCITFVAQHDTSSDVLETSDIGRLKELYENYSEALRRMLSWMAEFVTSEHMDTLISLHPDSDDLQEFMSWDQEKKLEHLKRGELVPMDELSLSMKGVIGTLHTVRDLLKLLSEHDAFSTATAKEYDAELRNGQVPPHLSAWYENMGYVWDDQRYTSSYTRHSQKKLLEEMVEPWWIIKEPDLLRWKRLLLPITSMYYPPPLSDLGSESESDSEPEREPYIPPRRKYYFSATACTIHFLKGLSKNTRYHIRNICIIEDHVSPSSQESQSFGLIPFCKENPRLQVNTQIGIWNVFFWKYSFAQDVHWARHEGIFGTVGEYLRETLLLPAYGIPTGQHSLELRGRTPEMTQHVWEGIKKVAAVHDAAREFHNRHPDQPKSWILWQSPSPDLHKLAKRVLQGGTAVWLDTSMGQPWDLDQAVLDLERSPVNADNWQIFLNLEEYEKQVEERKEVDEEYMYSDD